MRVIQHFFVTVECMKQGFYLYNESIEEVAIKCRRHSSLFVVKYAERIPTDDTTLWMGDLLGCTICWINWKIKSKLQACVILNNNSIWIYKIIISVIRDNLTHVVNPLHMYLQSPICGDTTQIVMILLSFQTLNYFAISCKPCSFHRQT